MAVKLTALKTQRQAAGLTVTQLARAANSSDLTVQRLENGGSCDSAEGERLVNALGVSKATAGYTDVGPT